MDEAAEFFENNHIGIWENFNEKSWSIFFEKNLHSPVSTIKN
jgi:hypothetical protein